MDEINEHQIVSVDVRVVMFGTEKRRSVEFVIKSGYEFVQFGCVPLEFLGKEETVLFVWLFYLNYYPTFQ